MSLTVLLRPILSLDLTLDTMSTTPENKIIDIDDMATPEPEKPSSETFFDLPAEVRNIIYGLDLEDQLQHLSGDIRDAIMDEERANHLALDWRSRKQTRMPTLCQVSKQVREETLSHVFSDYLPAMNVFKFGGAQYDNDCFEAWLDLYGKSIVPRLRYFLINTGTSRVAVVLNGSEEEVDVLKNEDVHSTGNGWRAESRAVAITHFRGQLVDENVLVWVEYAAVEIMSQLEELLLPNPTEQPRLSARKLSSLAKFCVKKLERNDDDESEEENEEEQSEDDSNEKEQNEDGTEEEDAEHDEDESEEEIEQEIPSWKLP